MKKIILIGKTESGKTTLIQKLLNRELHYKKTQTIETELDFIDTPGEYLENRMFYKALIVTSVEAEIIGFVEDCTSEEKWIPPMFSSTFSKDVIGIITKVDLGTDENIKKAEAKLYEAGCETIFKISAVDNTGIEELREYLNKK